MLWACLQFPHLPLTAVFADEADASLRACAVSEGPRQRPQIAAVNAPAHAAGVRIGQSAAAAHALCGTLLLRARDPRAELQILQLLAAWAYRFSGQVSVQEPDTLLLEIGASLTLFEGWPALRRRLVCELDAMGYPEPQLAVAPVAAAARVLARCNPGIALRHETVMLQTLAQAPLHASGLPEQTLLQLDGMGFRVLGELFALPRIELSRRIGPANLHSLDQLRGTAACTLPLYQPPDRFERRIELESYIHNWQILLFPLRRLVRELGLFLLLRDGGVQGFELVLEHEAHPPTRVSVGLLSVQRDADALFEFARGRLERCDIPADVSAISLHADDLPVFRPGHHDLFEPIRAQGLDWPALVERLRSRLGDQALQSLACVDEHRPECAWRFTPLAIERSVAVAPRKSATITTSSGVHKSHSGSAQIDTKAPRPLWLLRRPIPLRQAPVEILTGPERIESGWWDGHDARRDYYVVRSRDGQQAWAYLPAGAEQGWMLHGWFA